MGGTSVFRVRDDDPNRNVIVETVSQLGARTVMAQRFIPEISEGDKRILLIGGEVVPYSLARIPKPGETRGNLAAGGRGVAQPLSARDREIGEAMAGPLWDEGLLVVGHRRHRTLPDRSERDEPDLLRRDHRAVGLRRRRAVRRRAARALAVRR